MKLTSILILLIFVQCFFLIEDTVDINKKKYQVGFINQNGEIVIPYEYEMAGNFVKGLAPVKKNGLWGYINKKNQIIIPFQFHDAKEFSIETPYTAVSKKVGNEILWTFVDTNGEILSDPKFAYATKFRDGVAEVASSKYEYGLKYRYDKYFLTKNGKMIYHNGLYGYLSGPGYHSEGYLPSCENGKWGFKDLNGNWKIKPIYSFVGNFNNGRASIKITNPHPYNDCFYIKDPDIPSLWGFIDGTGKEIIPPTFFSVSDFENEIALVDKRENLYYNPDKFTKFYIDKNGNPLFDTKFNVAEPFNSSGYAKIGKDKNNKYPESANMDQFINTKGEILNIKLNKNERIFKVFSGGEGILRITISISTEKSTDFITRYYSSDSLKQIILQDYPPVYIENVFPPNELSGKFSEGFAWIANKK
jgi:hypothetical protein